jgi:type II secretory pathway pseudopilin PulG
MKLKRTLASQAGFTYIAMIVMVTVMLIMMGQVAISWKTFIQRTKEEELLFRGMQVREAMQRYYYGRVINVRTDLKPADTERANKQPNLDEELKDLLEDSHRTEKKRYLRPFALVDPMTNKPWALIRGNNQRIIGVKSTSKMEPIKKANFPYQLEPGDFERQVQQAAQGAVALPEQKPTYEDWQFIFDRIPIPKDEAGKGSLPGGTPSTPESSGGNPQGTPPGNPPPPRGNHRSPSSSAED